MSKPRVAVIYNAFYDDIIQLAEQEAKGIREAGGVCDIYKLTQSEGDYPLATNDTLQQYDAFMFGISSKMGHFPSPWRMLFDGTGAVWAQGITYHKACGVFVLTSSSNAGQESVVGAALSTLTHHGILFVPLGYKPVVKNLAELDQAHGGSPWGAGSFNNNGTRYPSDLELKTAYYQGKAFYNTISQRVIRDEETQQQ